MNLIWDSCDTLQLAKTYGTPLYVLSETMIRQRCREIHNTFLKAYDNTKAVYASKAFLTTAICKILEQENIGLDVVSGGELYTAIQSHFPMSMVEFNGNNKTYDELKMAIEHEVGRIIVDNVYELKLIEDLSKSLNKVTPILFRIVPETETDTHDYISTGHKTSKFGISLENDTILNVIKHAIDHPFLDYKGIHFHVGSQLHTHDSHLNALKKTLYLINDVKNTWQYDTKELNIGGGFGIYYTKADDVKSLDYFIEPCMSLVEDYCKKHDLLQPKVIIEPGRWIIGEAGITLYTIGSIKTNGGKTYLAVDGGMSDNIRPSLYQACYEATLCHKAYEKGTQHVTISGKFCESSDILIHDILLPEAKSGDILAIHSTGAYTYAMASNYNKQPLPCVILTHQGQSSVIVKRQSYEDLIRLECTPKYWEEK